MTNLVQCNFASATTILWFLLLLDVGSTSCGAASECPADQPGSCINSLATFDSMDDKVNLGDGFLAALDQSGGSTPKALALYGITEDVSVSNTKQ